MLCGQKRGSMESNLAGVQTFLTGQVMVGGHAQACNFLVKGLSLP